MCTHRHGTGCCCGCTQVWSLDEQISHKVAFLQEHVLLPGRPPVVLVAHSIGAYMAAKALRKLEQQQQQQAVLASIPATPSILKV